MVNQMVKGNGLYQMETSMKGNGRMGNIMVKEQKIGLMEESIKGNGKMGNIMVKEQLLMEKGNGKEISI